MNAGGWIFIPLVALEALANMVVAGTVLRLLLFTEAKLRLRKLLAGLIGGNIVTALVSSIGEILLDGTPADGMFTLLNRVFIGGILVVVVACFAYFQFASRRLRRYIQSRDAQREIAMLRWAVRHIPPQAFDRRPLYVTTGADPFGLSMSIRKATATRGPLLLRRGYNPDHYVIQVFYRVR